MMKGLQRLFGETPLENSSPKTMSFLSPKKTDECSADVPLQHRKSNFGNDLWILQRRQPPLLYSHLVLPGKQRPARPVLGPG